MKAFYLCYVSIRIWKSHLFCSETLLLKKKKLGKSQDLENLRFLRTSNFVCEKLEVSAKLRTCPRVQRKNT